MVVLIQISVSWQKKFLNNLYQKKILKIVTVGTKGFDQLKKEYGKFIIEKRNFKNVKKFRSVKRMKLENLY